MENERLLLEEEKEFKRFYRFSSWWIDNQERLKRVGLIVFGVIDAALLLYASWHLTDAFLLSYQREQRAVYEMVAYGQADLHAYTTSRLADPLTTGTVSILSSGEGKYDLYAALTNPNADWWADVTYRFRWDGSQTDAMHTFILPGAANKPLVAFAIASESAPRNASVYVEDVVWHRIDHALTGSYTSWETERLHLPLQDITFGPSELNSTIGRISFTVTNASPYSYYEPTFIILLKRGASVVGVTQTILSSLNTGEAQEVVVNWFGPMPNVGSVEIIPEINLFDLASYKPLTGESTIDTRTRVFSNRR